MQWGEFKKKVESLGVEDHTEIDWIDVTGYVDGIYLTEQQRGGYANIGDQPVFVSYGISS